MTIETIVTNNVKELAPIHGISFGDLDDPSTWTTVFKDEATVEQIQLAWAYILRVNPIKEKLKLQLVALEKEKQKEKELEIEMKKAEDIVSLLTVSEVAEASKDVKSFMDKRNG